MLNQKSIGLDELMIVNPGQPKTTEPGSPGLFLGQDGRLFQVEDAKPEQGASGLGEFFLGDDGNLYQLYGLQALAAPDGGETGLTGAGDLSGAGRLPRFFLGEDGTLYEIRTR